MHSTALGGKTVAEVGSNGVIGKAFVYSGGARIATQHLWTGGNSVEIESTNPVTGAAITTDANANYATRQEPDPLSGDLANPPPPTPPPSDPLGSTNFKDRAMPIEYTWGPSQEYFDNADIPQIAGAIGRIIMHELMHAGSGTNLDYRHYEMARAAWKVAKAQGYTGIGNEPSGGDPGGVDTPDGVTFNNILFQACPNVEARK